MGSLPWIITILVIVGVLGFINSAHESHETLLDVSNEYSITEIQYATHEANTGILTDITEIGSTIYDYGASIYGVFSLFPSWMTPILIGITIIFAYLVYCAVTPAKN